MREKQIANKDWRSQYQHLLRDNETPEWYLRENRDNLKTGRVSDLHDLAYKIEALCKLIYEDKQKTRQSFRSRLGQILRKSFGVQPKRDEAITYPIYRRDYGEEARRRLVLRHSRKVYTQGYSEGQCGGNCKKS